MKNLKIPRIDSIEELARFWDTHDLTDFSDDLEVVTESVFQEKAEAAVKIHLPAQEVEAVRRIAKSKGVGQAALLREWVLEKLHPN